MNGTDLKYTDMDWVEGSSQYPGIMRDVYAISKRDVVSFPTRKTTITTTMGELATLTGSFTLAAEAKWMKVGVLVDESPVSSKSQGSKPSKTFLNEATFMHPGVEEEAVGFATQANNDDMLFLFQQKNKKFRLLGNDMWQTEVEVEQTLGGAVTDKMGTKLVVKVSDISPAPFYTGEIVTEDGTINDVTP